MLVSLRAFDEDVVASVAALHRQRRRRVLGRLHDRLRLLQLAVVSHPVLEKRDGRFESGRTVRAAFLIRVIDKNDNPNC